MSEQTDAVTGKPADSRTDWVTVVSGWAAVVVGILVLHRAASMWTIRGDEWVLRGLIIFAALVLTWLWGYGPTLWGHLVRWARRGGLNATLVVISLLLGAGMVNWIVARRHWQWDLTKNRRYTMSDRTQKVLQSLKQPVRATVFIPTRFREQGVSPVRVYDLLKQYRSLSDKFSYQILDPFEKASEFQRLFPEATLDDLNAAVLEVGEGERARRQVITGFAAKASSGEGEKELTGAIIKLTRESVRKIGFLQGHGEVPHTSEPTADPRGSLSLVARQLTDVQWEFETIQLYGEKAQTPDPEKIAVIVIAGPRRELDKTEIERLNEYLNKGGRVLVMLEAGGPSLQEFLGRWGVQVGNDLVLDLAEGPVVPVFRPEAGADLARGIEITLHLAARTVTAAPNPPEGVVVTPLLKTQAQRTRIIPNYNPRVRLEGIPPNARAEAATLGVVVQKTLSSSSEGQEGGETKTARLVVFGDTMFATDRLASSYFNDLLFTNAVNWLAEEDALVSIPPKEPVSDTITLPAEQWRIFQLLHLLDFPLLAIALGIFVYLRRR